MDATHSYALTPTLNFPYYVERSWFGEDVSKMTAHVFEQTDDGLVQCGTRTRGSDGRLQESPPVTLQADGVLATLPMLVGQGRFRVRYYRGRELKKTAVAKVTRSKQSGTQTQVELEATY